MKQTALLALLVVVVLHLPVLAQRATSQQTTLANVTVVDVAEGRLLPDQNVVVSGNRITQVSRASASSRRGHVVDATGKFLIPGLWDMHTHLFDVDTPGSTEVTFPLMIANGITGIRDTGAMLDLLMYWRDQIDAGTVVGPRIVGTGALLDGAPTVYPLMSTTVLSPDDGRRAVDALAARGVDFVKVYEMLARDVFFAVIDQAKKRNLPAIGHVPLSVDAAEASNVGMRSFEHLRNLELACSSESDSLRQQRTAMLNPTRNGAELRTEIHSSQRPRAVETYDPARCEALMAHLDRNQTWQVPTLFLNSREAFRPDKIERVRATMRFVPAGDRADWEQWSVRVSALPPEDAQQRMKHAQWQVGLVGKLSKAGVGLLAGTDISVQWIVPGYSLHEELRALTGAGLTPLQALQAATINPAKYYGVQQAAGTIQAGALADLVLLDANPLSDIRHTEMIRAVVANGRYLDRTKLDQMLSQAEAAARRIEEARPKRPKQRLQPAALADILKRRG